MKKNSKNLQINGLYFMRLITLTIMLALSMPVIVNAQTEKADFTDNWVINHSKSHIFSDLKAITGFGGGMEN